MTLLILLASTGLNILFTILIVLVLLGIYFFQSRVVSKHQDDMSKTLLVLTYIILFILFIGAIVGSLLIWEYDFGILSNNFVTEMTTIFSDKVGTLIGSIFTLFVALMILKISKIGLYRVGLKPGPMQRRKKTIAKVMMSITKYAVYFLAILIILALWGVNVVPALAGLGVAGVVIGLGAQKFINDLISGFFIVFEHHFDVGDIIEVKGFKGEVTDIGLKTSKIKGWRGDVKILNNGDIDDLTNFSLNPSIGIIDFGIAYPEDAQKTIELLKAELPKLRPLIPDALDDPQVLGVMDLADSSVNMRVIVKTITERHYGIERIIRQRIKEILDENHIEIPFPQVVVHQGKE
jgi:small conductance mechanosensitive channel